MKQHISVGIVGYGYVGRGAEMALFEQPDMTLEAIFTRRDPGVIEPFHTDTKVERYETMTTYQDRIDVMIVCGQSKADLGSMSPHVAKMFNMVDSYDIHADMLAHLDHVGEPAEQNETTAIIGVGWDPGLFSMQRLLGEIVLPAGRTDTFWGKGLSQGHTAAVKSIDGVIDAVQYTMPKEHLLDAVRSGETIDLPSSQRHRRICYVVAEHPDLEATIRYNIQTMPHYFADYDTTVYFIDEQTMREEHGLKPHGGHVIRTGETSSPHQHRIELTMKLANNPEFTGSVLAAYARAACTLERNGQTGAKTVYDIPLSYLTPRPIKDVIQELL